MVDLALSIDECVMCDSGVEVIVFQRFLGHSYEAWRSCCDVLLRDVELIVNLYRPGQAFSGNCCVFSLIY